MKNTLVIAGAAAAGLIAGGLSPLLFSGSITGSRSATPAAAPGLTPRETASEDPESETLAAELEALRSEIEALQMRIAWLESDADDRREPVAVASELAEASDTESDALVAALSRPGEPLPEQLKLGVEQVLQDVRDAERAERAARRAEVLEEQTEERLTELVTELGLTPVQTDQMRDHMTAYAKKRADLMDTARENGDFMSTRESMRDLRRESYDALATILDPVQIERYRELDDDRRGGRDRRGRDREEDRAR